MWTAKTGWKETKHQPNVEGSHETSWVGRTNIMPWPRLFVLYSTRMQNVQDFRRSNRKTTKLGRDLMCTSLLGPTIWKVMQRNVWSGIASWPTKQLSNSLEFQLHALMTTNSMKKSWDLWENCQTYALVLKCLYLARIGRADIRWSVNTLARAAVTKWTRACDRRLTRFISYILCTSEFKQCCHVGNTQQQCRPGLFQDSGFARDLEDSKSTSGGILCIFGSHTFVPMRWMCKKQTSVSHSLTEA